MNNQSAEAEALLELSEELVWAFVRDHLRRLREISSHWKPGDFRYGMESMLDEMDVRLTPLAYKLSLTPPTNHIGPS